MLPPQRISPTRLPAKRSRKRINAASPAAPAPSTTVFSISSNSRMAMLEIALRDQHDVVDQALDERKCDRTPAT